jgi:hypothetical protein
MKALGWTVGALALAGLGAPAQAVDWRAVPRDGDRYYRSGDPGRIAYDEGYRDGLKQGEKDGRKGDRFDVRRHGDYRDADDGYRREFGPKSSYQRVYRRGFEDGYRRTYEAYAYGYGYGPYGYGDRGSYGRDGYYGGSSGRDGAYGRYRDRDRYDDRDRYEDRYRYDD